MAMDQVIILGGVDLTYLIKAATKFQEILQMQKNEVVRDAAIQRFEFTYELVWKILKRILFVKGITANNPRDVFRESAKQGIISNLELWFKYIEYRNQTTHVYNEIIADEIFFKLPGFDTLVQGLIIKCLNMDKA
jgi:nucleotidyltransferase substrate binding protein (TIGR01987 family)